jgi:hypothetical protein
MSNKRSAVGGMQTSALNSNYCPVWCQELAWVGYQRLGFYSHMSKKGTLMLCDTNNNLKQKRIKSEDWHKIQAQYEASI